MKETAREAGSAGVPERAKQAEEAEQRRERWGWVEPVVWTDRMVAALETGVKGGQWYSLLDKVYAERTVAAAWKRVERNSGSAGVDRQSVQAFGARAEAYLAEIVGDHADEIAASSVLFRPRSRNHASPSQRPCIRCGIRGQPTCLKLA